MMTEMHGERLTKLRQVLKRQGLDGFVVPHADEHLGEYVPASAERLAWLTGFSGSAGLAVVLAEKAAVFTDGRYLLQLAVQPTEIYGSVGLSPTNPRPVGFQRMRWPARRSVTIQC